MHPESPITSLCIPSSMRFLRFWQDRGHWHVRRNSGEAPALISCRASSARLQAKTYIKDEHRETNGDDCWQRSLPVVHDAVQEACLLNISGVKLDMVVLVWGGQVLPVCPFLRSIGVCNVGVPKVLPLALQKSKLRSRRLASQSRQFPHTSHMHVCAQHVHGS